MAQDEKIVRLTKALTQKDEDLRVMALARVGEVKYICGTVSRAP